MNPADSYPRHYFQIRDQALYRWNNLEWVPVPGPTPPSPEELEEAKHELIELRRHLG
jgi:hypothetical protein